MGKKSQICADIKPGIRETFYRATAEYPGHKYAKIEAAFSLWADLPVELAMLLLAKKKKPFSALKDWVLKSEAAEALSDLTPAEARLVLQTVKSLRPEPPAGGSSD